MTTEYEKPRDDFEKGLLAGLPLVSFCQVSDTLSRNSRPLEYGHRYPSARRHKLYLLAVFPGFVRFSPTNGSGILFSETIAKGQ